MFFSHSIFLVSLSNLHHLLSLSLCFLNLFPGLSLFHFEQSDTIGKQFGIVGSLLFIETRLLQSTSDLLTLFLIVVIFTVFLPIVILTIVLLFIHFVLLFIAELLIGRMLLSLWHWLSLLRGLDLIDLLVIVIHCADNHSVEFFNYIKTKNVKQLSVGFKAMLSDIVRSERLPFSDCHLQCLFVNN